VGAEEAGTAAEKVAAKDEDEDVTGASAERCARTRGGRSIAAEMRMLEGRFWVPANVVPTRIWSEHPARVCFAVHSNAGNGG
jgi:hypothetical protein